MSSVIKRTVFAGILCTLMFLMSACGDPNSTATFDPETSVHPADWLPAGHVGPAREDTNSCGNCHGTDLTGGISRVSCTTCHIGSATEVHPEVFNGFPWLEGGHGRYVVSNGTSSCANIWCHGFDLQGVAESGPSCRECHTFP